MNRSTYLVAALAFASCLFGTSASAHADETKASVKEAPSLDHVKGLALNTDKQTVHLQSELKAKKPSPHSLAVICKSDLAKYCKGVQRGKGRLYACLERQLRTLQSKCRNKVTRHLKRKAHNKPAAAAPDKSSNRGGSSSGSTSSTSSGNTKYYTDGFDEAAAQRGIDKVLAGWRNLKVGRHTIHTSYRDDSKLGSKSNYRNSNNQEPTWKTTESDAWGRHINNPSGSLFGKTGRDIYQSFMGKGAPEQLEAALNFALKAGKIGTGPNATLEQIRTWAKERIGVECAGTVTIQILKNPQYKNFRPVRNTATTINYPTTTQDSGTWNTSWGVTQMSRITQIIVNQMGAQALNLSYNTHDITGDPGSWRALDIIATDKHVHVIKRVTKDGSKYKVEVVHSGGNSSNAAYSGPHAIAYWYDPAKSSKWSYAGASDGMGYPPTGAKVRRPFAGLGDKVKNAKPCSPASKPCAR